jgi:hypothetical protein
LTDQGEIFLVRLKPILPIVVVLPDGFSDPIAGEKRFP